MPFYSLHLLNRKVRVRLGRFFGDFGSGPLRVTFAIVRFMTDRYPLHERSVEALQYKAGGC
jgi:hypothetical protein